jgi:diguanylate cyclase (GGDEF)-like protein/PAS domain S-box-containing protein
LPMLPLQVIIRRQAREEISLHRLHKGMRGPEHPFALSGAVPTTPEVLVTQKKTVIFLLLFFSIEAVLFGLLFWIKERAEHHYLQSVLTRQQGEYNATLAGFSRLARFTAQETFMGPDVVDLFAHAAQAGHQERQQLRQALSTLLLPSYHNFSQEYFHQVRYHFADGSTFLDLDQPTHGDDSPLPAPPSVRIANREQRPVTGLEIDGDHLVLRHVFPLPQKEKYLGSVGLSVPFSLVGKALQQIYPEEYLVLLNKDLSLARLERQGLEKYGTLPLVDSYLQAKTDLSSSPLPPELLVHITKAVRSHVAGSGAAVRPFAQGIRLDHQNYRLTFLPLEEVRGQNAGLLVSYGVDLSLASIRYWYIAAHLLGTLLFMLLFGLHLRGTRMIDRQLAFQRQLMESIPIPICLKDLHGVFTNCNQAFVDMFCLTRTKIIGHRFPDLINAQAAAQQEALDATVIASGQTQQQELHQPYADGTSRDLLMVKAPFIDEHGRIAGVIGSAVDVTDQRRSEAEIEKAHAELEQIFNTAANGMRVVDLHYTILRANTTFYTLTGLSEEEVVGKKCYEVFPGPDCQTLNCPLSRIMEGAQRLEVEVAKALPSGRKIDCLITSTPYYGPHGELLGIIEDFKDITRYKELEKSLRETAITDELTGLFNRRGFLTLAEKQLGNALRADLDMFLIFADVDNLKVINDTLGHDTGDLLLVTAAELVRTTFRQADIVARLGGDEFAVFISCRPGTESEEVILARLEENIAQENQAGKLPFILAISFGVVRFKENETLEQVMTRADDLMYASKSRKKG